MFLGISNCQLPIIILYTLSSNHITICELKHFYYVISPPQNVRKSFFLCSFLCCIDSLLCNSLSFYVSFFAATFLPFSPQLSLSIYSLCALEVIWYSYKLCSQLPANCPSLTSKFPQHFPSCVKHFQSQLYFLLQ